VIDVLGRAAAILTPMIVPEEDRSPREGKGPGVGNGHIPPEPNHRRDVERRRLCVPGLAELGDRIGRAAKDEHDSPPGRHHRQRFVAGVEDECSRHGRKRSKHGGFVLPRTSIWDGDD